MAKGVNYTDRGEDLIIPRCISRVIGSNGYGAIITTTTNFKLFQHALGYYALEVLVGS
jgi:hypothetical protein